MLNVPKVRIRVWKSIALISWTEVVLVLRTQYISIFSTLYQELVLFARVLLLVQVPVVQMMSRRNDLSFIDLLLKQINNTTEYHFMDVFNSCHTYFYQVSFVYYLLYLSLLFVSRLCKLRL
jgi:hypothetical protein